MDKETKRALIGIQAYLEEAAMKHVGCREFVVFNMYMYYADEDAKLNLQHLVASRSNPTGFAAYWRSRINSHHGWMACHDRPWSVY